MTIRMTTKCELKYTGLWLKLKTKSIDEHIYWSIRSADIANISPTHLGCRGGAKGVKNSIVY